MNMNNKIIGIQSIDFQWQVENPFLFCAHHKDAYPKGNKEQGPEVSLKGREIHNDFSRKDGFSMYHGDVVPGFPVHPHRGFETVTVVLDGVVDHFDSKGAHGRYANGDVQWLTTGAGCQHSEMFPLVNEDKENPTELFQIWLNLAKKDKFTDPDYKMMWSEDIPVLEVVNKEGKKATVKVIAGNMKGIKSLEPCNNSWAKDRNNNVGIYLVHMEPNSSIALDAVSESLIRNLYFYQGEGNINVEGHDIKPSNRVKLSGDDEIKIINGDKESYMLILEGEPILEPGVQYGPFVMNTKEEIQEAIRDYQETEFGGWPWEKDDPIHDKNQGRIAYYPDGSIEKR